MSTKTVSDSVQQLVHKKIPTITSHSGPLYTAVLVKGLANTNYSESSIFDFDHYFDPKSREKTHACNFFKKETIHIAKLVRFVFLIQIHGSAGSCQLIRFECVLCN